MASIGASISKFLRGPLAGPLAAMLLAAFAVSLTTDRFFMAQNLMNVSLQVSTTAIIAIGATMVILTGGIDLSPGSIVALTSCVLAILVKNMGIPLVVAAPMVLLLGVLLGTVNGFLSTYLRIPAFIATLATMIIYRGLAFLVTNGSPIFSLAPELQPVFYGKFLGIPLPFYYVVVLYIVAYIFLRNTATGRAIYAVGGNESAARFSGISVNRTRMLAFIIAGAAASVAGLLLAARLDSGSPNYGSGAELEAIAAAVIGGASLTGGYGNVLATLFGALTVAIVQNGLNLNAVPTSWQNITLGVIILLAVALDMWRADVAHAIGQLISRLRAQPASAGPAAPTPSSSPPAPSAPAVGGK